MVIWKVFTINTNIDLTLSMHLGRNDLKMGPKSESELFTGDTSEQQSFTRTIARETSP